MRALIVIVGLGVACATPRVCPTGTTLARRDSSSGRMEWCAVSTAGVHAMPAPGRSYTGSLGMTRPATLTSGLRGPFTHWYPNGAVESHGHYVEDGSTSVADGIWAFWYPTGARKSVGRFERGQPVGCFAQWDEQGNQITGVAEGDRLRELPCEPPLDVVAEIERRSHLRAGRDRWGDLSIAAIANAGELGASNQTQTDAEPGARATIETALRRYVGRFRIGPAVELRLSDSADARAYSAGAVAAIDLPIRRRFSAEIETLLGVHYLEVTARRMDVPGTAKVQFWSPRAGLRARLSFEVTPRLRLDAGASVDGVPNRSADRELRYCAPTCGPEITEIWTIGGVTYGAALGLRVLLR